MDASTHAAVGVALGSLARSPAEAFLLGFLSHTVCDLVPHGDPHPLEIDSLPYWLYAGYLIKRFGRDEKSFWGGLGATLPDFEHVLYYFNIIPRVYFPTHVGAHCTINNKLLGHLVNIGVNVVLFFLWKRLQMK